MTRSILIKKEVSFYPFYREKDITYNKDSDFLGRSIEVEKLMAYEMARQVFVGLIGKKNRKADQWTNEMLSSFYSYYLVDEVFLSKKSVSLKLIICTLSVFAVEVHCYLS